MIHSLWVFHCLNHGTRHLPSAVLKWLFSTGILAFFHFLAEMTCTVELFLHSKEEERLWSSWNISSFLKLANVTSTYWATSGALPGYACLPIALCLKNQNTGG